MYLRGDNQENPGMYSSYCNLAIGKLEAFPGVPGQWLYNVI